MLTTDPEIALPPTTLDDAPKPPAPVQGAAAEAPCATPAGEDKLESLGPFAARCQAILNHEVTRFLIVGCCNTGFAYVLYAGFGALYTHLFPQLNQIWIADAALITSWPIGVTGSFLGFKHFVFKTKGNYLKEWLRCLAVYSVTVPASLVIIAAATKAFQSTTLPPLWAKYAAGVVNSGIIAGYSYVANKKFSFKKS